MSSSGASVSTAATRASRKSIRQSVLSSFQPAAIPNHEDPMPLLPTAGRSIKVVPYVNGRQVIGIAILIIWPIILGTAFNVYSFEEASAYLEIRLDVERYQARVERVQGVIDTLITAQDTLLKSLIQRNGRAAQVAADFGRTATQELQSLDAAYPELTENHKRVTPKVILDKLTMWIAGVKNFNAVDPTNLVDNLSEVIKGVRMFFSAYHVTSLRGGDTWNDVLQQLFISEVGEFLTTLQITIITETTIRTAITNLITSKNTVTITNTITITITINITICVTTTVTSANTVTIRISIIIWLLLSGLLFTITITIHVTITITRTSTRTIAIAFTITIGITFTISITVNITIIITVLTLISFCYCFYFRYGAYIIITVTIAKVITIIVAIKLLLLFLIHTITLLLPLLLEG